MCYRSDICPCDGDQDYECLDCEKYKERIKSAGEFLTGVIELMTGTDDINISDLEFYLEELTGFLDVNWPTCAADLDKINIRRA